MKIAVLGSASSSVHRAPFQNAAHKAWQQGRVDDVQRAHDAVPGEWDIWGCSPGCWSVCPRATRWFEVHRWEGNVPWFSPQYIQFLRDFKGPVYTGGAVPEIPNHVVFPIDRLEEKFSSYFMTSSLALMMALAIDTIEQIRDARRAVRKIESAHDAGIPIDGFNPLPSYIDAAELEKTDNDDVIGLWGVDMAASEEYAYQRPGCHFFVLEAMRRGIGVYLPPESDLMRPQPVYGISEWDHNYIKLTSRARELNQLSATMQKQASDATQQLAGLQGEQHALQAFVSTWTSPYGMLAGMVIRQADGTGLGSGITHYDGRPVTRMTVAAPAPVMQAMTESPDVALGRELVAALGKHAGETGLSEGAVEVAQRLGREGSVGRAHSILLQDFAHPGEASVDTLRRLIKVAVQAGKREVVRPTPKAGKKRRR